MASTKNVQALNNRLDVACRSRIDEFYRQHVSSLAHLEHQKLDTARLLKSVRKCPSDHEALSIKFLGPAPKSGSYRRGRQPLDDPTAVKSKSGSQSARQSPEPAAVQPVLRRQHTANPFANMPADIDATLKLERAKTFADTTATKTAAAAASGQRRRRRSRSRRQRHRARTPLPSKMERFYAHLEDTKRGCGLQVIDATQTPEAHQFYLTLSRAEWLARLAKIDPEYFKNAHLNDSENDADSASESENED